MLFADTVLKYKNYAVLKQKASDKRFNIIRFFFGSEKFFNLIALCLMNIHSFFDYVITTFFPKIQNYF